jgi:hypothetical protein
MTPFCFEHVFRAPSTAAVFAAYFDAGHQIEQDQAAAIVLREVLAQDATSDVLRRTCRVVPRRQLPLLVKRLTSGELHYIETIEWKRADDTMTMEIRPSLLHGRVQVVGTYELARVAPGEIRRRYAGEVSVDIAVLGSRIERGIVAELAKTLPISAAGTQDWLDRQVEPSLAARA